MQGERVGYIIRFVASTCFSPVFSYWSILRPSSHTSLSSLSPLTRVPLVIHSPRQAVRAGRESRAEEWFPAAAVQAQTATEEVLQRGLSTPFHAVVAKIPVIRLSQNDGAVREPECHVASISPCALPSSPSPFPLGYQEACKGSTGTQATSPGSRGMLKVFLPR
jgi:hypothetical protein